jgi:RNA polymerase sigma-70 factor (ECF subfamily)
VLACKNGSNRLPRHAFLRQNRENGGNVDPLFPPGIREALMPTFRRGATRALMRELLPAMLRVVRQVLGAGHPDAEDVLQDAAYALLEALVGFREECTVRHFACRVALLTSLNARRSFLLRERLTPSATPAEVALIVDDDRDQPDRLAERRRAAVLRLLNELPQPQAETLALHCVLGYTVAETAQATGVPANTVRSRLVSAKSLLRDVLSEDGELAEQLREWSRGAG